MQQKKERVIGRSFFVASPQKKNWKIQIAD